MRKTFLAASAAIAALSFPAMAQARGRAVANTEPVPDRCLPLHLPDKPDLRGRPQHQQGDDGDQPHAMIRS